MRKLYTIGHSTHTLPEFLTLLHAHEIQHIVDIRTIPKSRLVPWFNQRELHTALQQQKILYTHMASLGG